MTETGGRTLAGSAPVEVAGPSQGLSAQGLSATTPPAPLWRFRTAIAPKVVRSLRTKILPRIFHGRKPAAAFEIADHESDAIRAFAALTLSADANAASSFVDRLLAQGTAVEEVFLHWLAPAARELGAQWETDETDFAKVTLGVNRLHMIMRRLGDDFCGAQPYAEGGESALLTVVPGEQHSFGLSMVAEFFRRAGWNLCTGPFTSHRELTSLVHTNWFDVVGFSVSSDRRLDELKRDIDAIRSGSRNQSVGILLGGPMLATQPELAHSLGADMVSIDAASAPRQAQDLVNQIKAKSKPNSRH